MDVRARIERLTSAEAPPGRGDRIAYHGIRVGLVLGLAMFTYVLFPASPAVESPLFEVGSVASESVIAPFAFTVRKTEAELARERDELAQSAKPIFVYAPAALDSSRQQLAGFMLAIAKAAEGRGAGKGSPAVRESAEKLGVSVTEGEAEYLTFAGRRRAMENSLDRVMSRWLAAGIASSGAIDAVRGEVILRRGDEERSILADSITTFVSLLARARRLHPDPNSSAGDGLYIKLLSAFFHPTVVLDRVATEERRQELRASVNANRYEVRAGEKIVGEHEVVGREEHDKMRALHDAMQTGAEGQRGLGRILGAVLYNFLVLTIFGITLVLFRPQLYRAFRSLVMFALVFAVVLAGAAIAGHAPEVHPELVPIALAAVMCSMLFDPRISMIAAMILAVLVGGQSVFRGTNALFLNLIGGAAAAISVQVIRRRSQVSYSILPIFAAYMLAAVALGLTLDWSARDILHSALWGGGNAVVSVALAMILLPLAERFTGITTDLTLLEHSDLNRPLLKRLMMEAPGTFDHTMRMANLVEAGCTAIGANGLLGRVGTYYHDIGKLKKPQFFVENQPKGRNPHDKLKPGTSAQIIRNHVREGVELAEEAGVPPVIRAFIPEHHGTSAISYFLEKARERDTSISNAADYSYPGPIPQSAETAVCMLADGVEAAARVIQDPTQEKIREVIDHIVRQRMEQGQLRDAPITLQQLDQVKEQFARVLVGNYHTRIEYPAASGGVTSEFASSA